MAGATNRNTLLNEYCNAAPLVEERSALILVDDLRNVAYSNYVQWQRVCLWLETSSHPLVKQHLMLMRGYKSLAPGVPAPYDSKIRCKLESYSSVE
ncbi:hypothetical protein AVEN_92218-1 [Araneus ventricosus]|uniref:Uncharacterized protein n=1 Tax=Araneus ventricosus TaxID=182803 RepID=A0A4Y2AKB1_ARAVE|nr:hypothetical protein AVEN_92218-1 [Araneus ventricosus]